MIVTKPRSIAGNKKMEIKKGDNKIIFCLIKPIQVKGSIFSKRKKKVITYLCPFLMPIKVVFICFNRTLIEKTTPAA